MTSLCAFCIACHTVARLGICAFADKISQDKNGDEKDITLGS